MKPSVALDLKRAAVREAVKRFHTTNPRILGSVLHGADELGSDLDLLVDALPDYLDHMRRAARCFTKLCRLVCSVNGLGSSSYDN